MKKIIIDFEISGCLNNCYHCHCNGGIKEREFMNQDKVIDIASKFRDKLDVEVSVRLVQEQTYYPDFFDLVTKLEDNGFMKKGNEKLLVTNCWGLANKDGFVSKLKEHFNVVKPTLFGLSKTHDIHAGRKGSFDEIIKGTKLCLKEGIDIVWQIMVTQKNSTEIDELYKLGRDLEVEKIFITAEHYYVGRVQSFNKMNEFFPRISNLKDVKKEVYQLENGVIKPEKEYIEDLEKNINYKISNVNFNEIYIDKDFNVYPIFHLSSEFLLGNAIDSFDKVRDRILHNKDLPSKMIEKNSLNFIDLIRKYADKDSNELHTPQSLFDKLSTIELQG